MHGSKNDIPAAIETNEVIIQEIEWGDIHVGFESYHQAFDVTPLLKGLPDDRCQCPHWGYVVKGRMRANYADHEEVVEAGNAYYLPPGHTVMLDAGTELIEFSPREPYQQTMEVVARNFEAMMQ